MSDQEQQPIIEEDQLEEVSSPKEEESDEQIGGLTRNIFSPTQTLNVLGMGSENIDNISWQDFNEYQYVLNADPVPDDENPYDFDLFEPGEVNIGLCLVYRQEWRPLGNQRGEIIRTIPLGPKQQEKVSTKIVRRTKVTKTAETLKSIESTKETSDTVKDSSEIINEAAETSGMQASISGSYNAICARVSASASFQKNSENRSKNLSSKLSESMQKTAGKIRSETRTMVSTESESTYEMATASEIQNPNEEIAITYVYSKLQRQYEIFTSLAEIHPVVMIPLPIPAPGEIDDNKWIRKYDWILAKVLLDDSYRDALTYISQNPADMSTVSSKADDALASFKTIRSEKNLSNLAPILKDGQPAFMDMLKQNIEQENQRRIMEYKCERLKDHIKDNILHYYQAIWSQQDSQQQLLKLKKSGIKVPTKWTFKGNFGDTEYTGKKFEKTVYDLLDEIIDYQLKPFEIDEAEFENQIKQKLADLENDRLAERDTKIETELGVINRTYEMRIAQVTKIHNELCEETVTKTNIGIRDSALESNTELKNLKKGFANQIIALCNKIVNTNKSYNKNVPNSNKDLRLPVELSGENLDGIRGFIDLCKRLVIPVSNQIGLYGIHVLALTGGINAPLAGASFGFGHGIPVIINPGWVAAARDYINKHYPLWIKELERIKAFQNQIDALVNRIVLEILPKQQEEAAKIRKLFKAKISEDTERCESERNIEINTTKQQIIDYYAAEIPKEKEWMRKKLIRELKEDIDFSGDFLCFTDQEDDQVDITEIINPAGPIAYHGNYAIYYLKPEVQSSDLMTILTIMKTPYLYYTSRDKAPTLVDPLLKRYLKDYQGVVPSMDDRYEMVEYVPDLRLHLSLAQADSRTFVPQSSDDKDPIEKLLTDDRLFASYYPEYLFRKELTRRFVVDTNNIILDIEPGRGSALESFKLAHRGIDVQKAVEERDKLKLENKRMIELLSQKKLDSRFWPDAQKFVAFTGGNGMQYGITPKPTAEGVAAELTAVPIITPPSSQEMGDHHASIYGRVEKAKDRTPVKGAEIRILRLKKAAEKPEEKVWERKADLIIKTSANGMFSSEVEDGKYQVLAAAPKFKPASYTVELKEEQSKEFLFNLQPLVSSRGYIGNGETMELHKPDCPWVALMDKENKVKLGTLKEALSKGFDKCGHCLE